MTRRVPPRRPYEFAAVCADLKQAHSLREFLVDRDVNPGLLYVTCFGGPPTVMAHLTVKGHVEYLERLATRFFKGGKRT